MEGSIELKGVYVAHNLPRRWPNKGSIPTLVYQFLLAHAHSPGGTFVSPQIICFYFFLTCSDKSVCKLQVA